MAKTQGPTYNPSKITRIRKLGFMSRMANWKGRRLLARRRAKNRTQLSVADTAAFNSKMAKNKRMRRRK